MNLIGVPREYKCSTYQYGQKVNVSESIRSSSTAQNYQYDQELCSVLTIYLVLGQYNQEVPYQYNQEIPYQYNQEVPYQ
jgi:hypothetical protein